VRTGAAAGAQHIALGAPRHRRMLWCAAAQEHAHHEPTWHHPAHSPMVQQWKALASARERLWVQARWRHQAERAQAMHRTSQMQSSSVPHRSSNALCPTAVGSPYCRSP
jgi:hypothetical protein